jgi:hypothetical protein
MYFWCNQIPEAADYYLPSGLRVDWQYAFFINSVQETPELKRLSERIAALGQAFAKLNREEQRLKQRRDSGEIGIVQYLQASARVEKKRAAVVSGYAKALDAAAQRRPATWQVHSDFVLAQRHVSDRFGNPFETRQCDTQPHALREWLRMARHAAPVELLLGSATLTTNADNAARPGHILLSAASPAAANEGLRRSDQELDGTDVWMRLRVSKIDVLQFNRGDWFNRDMITRYAKGVESGEPPFWGRGGSFSLLPYALILVYSPQLELRIPSAQYEDFRRWMEKDGTLIAGPFRFPVEQAMRPISLEEEAVSLTFSSPSDRAFVVGLVSQVMPQ